MKPNPDQAPQPKGSAPLPALSVDPSHAKRKEIAAAFEWLRSMALSDSGVARVAETAIQEWHRLASRAPAQAPEPLATKDVLAAIYAVDREAARRGEMFPQTADEQRDDRRAVTRVTRMLTWYEGNTGCARIKDWPHRATAQAPEQPVHLTAPLVERPEAVDALKAFAEFVDKELDGRAPIWLWLARFKIHSTTTATKAPGAADEGAGIFTPSEINYLGGSPTALREAANYHDVQATEASAIDPEMFASCVDHSEARAKELRAMADQIERDH